MIELELKAIVMDNEDTLINHTIYLFNKERGLVLPIRIPQHSANAILLAKEGRQEPRPHVHDTATRLIKALDGKVTRVFLSGYSNEIFYSYIRVKKGRKEFDVDAKPSDSLAIALRTKAPIFAEESVIEEAGIKITPEMLQI